jgi:sugar phosphate isomerase/epimerase
VDWGSIFSTLKDAGFGGPCVVEVVGGSTPEEADVEAARAREITGQR